MRVITRWCWRYGLPLMLMAAGWWLWRLGAVVPGAPVVVPEIMPSGLVVDRSGDLYVGDPNNACVWRINRWGGVERVAGNGKGDNNWGDGGKAVEVSLWYPSDIAFDVEGNLYIVDEASCRVRKVNKAGIITTVAGNGERGNSEDGGQAVKAELSGPAGIGIDAENNLYIADCESHRVRKVNKAGVIETVAGNGQKGYSGNGEKAVEARLSYPLDVAFDAAGNLYIAEAISHIRRVDKAGIITTVAGNGHLGHEGDGEQAIKASLFEFLKISFDAVGNLYIADGDRIRKVDKTGIITTVVGGAEEEYNRDTTRVGKVSLSYPWGIAFDAVGNLYIADSDYSRVCKADKFGNFRILVTGQRRFGR